MAAQENYEYWNKKATELFSYVITYQIVPRNLHAAYKHAESMCAYWRSKIKK